MNTPAPLPNHGAKNVTSPQGNQKHLDMGAARAATQAQAAGRPSDNDADEGTPTGGWTNGIAGINQGPSNGVNAGARPASSTSRMRSGGGTLP